MSARDPFLERVELGGADLHGQNRLVRAALRVAIGSATHAARAGRRRLLRRGLLLVAGDAAETEAALLLAVVLLRLFSLLVLIVRLLLVAAGQPRCALDIRRHFRDRLRVKGDVGLVARLGGRLPRQLLGVDLLRVLL